MHLASCECQECAALRGQRALRIDGSALPRRYRLQNGVLVPLNGAPRIPDTLREMVETAAPAMAAGKETSS